MHEGRKLRVMPERTNPDDQRRIRQYYASMKTDGCPFDTPSPKYAPMKASEFCAVLHELRFKNKASPMAQLADLVLWPVAIARYRQNRVYDEFRKHCLLVYNRAAASLFPVSHRDTLSDQEFPPTPALSASSVRVPRPASSRSTRVEFVDDQDDH